MIMTEAKGSTIQTTFGIVGLTRSELDEVQCFIDGLRKFTSDNEPMSGRGLAAQSRAQSQPDAMKWNAAVANSMALQPDQAAGRRAKVKQPWGEAKARPMASCNMKRSVLTKSLRLRAKRGQAGGYWKSLRITAEYVLAVYAHEGRCRTGHPGSAVRYHQCSERIMQVGCGRMRNIDEAR